MTLRPFVGIAIIVRKKNKILLGQRKNSHGSGCWAPPGGHLEFQESPEECVKRELLEETNLIALSIKEGRWVNNIIENKHYVTLFMFVDEFKGEVVCLEPEKCLGWEWFDIKEIPHPLFSPFETFLKKSPL